jgi:hypothetical protein
VKRRNDQRVVYHALLVFMKPLKLLAALAITSAGSLNAKVYYFKDFKADFPGQPEVSYTKAHDSYCVVGGGRKQWYDVTIYNDSNVTYTLDDIRSFALTSVQEGDAIIHVVKDVTWQGFPARHIVYEYTWNGKKVIRSKLEIFAYPKRYVVNFYTQPPFTDEDLYKRTAFFDSFTLKSNAEPEVRPAVATGDADAF